MKTIRIDRSKWLNGKLLKEVKLPSRLLEPRTGTMCCLGFYANQCGVPKTRLKNVSVPSSLHEKDYQKFGPLYGSDKLTTLMAVNDTYRHTPKKREAEIKKIFAEAGIKVTFHGRYPSKKAIEKMDEKVTR